MNLVRYALTAALISGLVVACDDSGSDNPTPVTKEGVPAYGYNASCVQLGNELGDLWLQANADGTSYAFAAADASDASKFYLKASDTGMYLLYDENGGYVVADETQLVRRTELESSVQLLDDNFISPAEWRLETVVDEPDAFLLRNRQTDQYLSANGTVSSAGGEALSLSDAEGCAEHPEMSADATGDPTQFTFEDGDLFGVADTHSHILSNFGFGGGGIFHGSPFHRLGVEHALGDCTAYHGEDGKKDFLGFGFNANNSNALGIDTLLPLLTDKELPGENHNTDGWPTFSDWPGTFSSTHQTQYYKWLERAWRGGLRLMVQHAVSNEALCDLMVDAGIQPARYECQDMLNIDRQIMEIYRMERYIDAQNGGPGEGWFRVVESPEEAREVIGEGKLAIILGIEVPNLFSCYLTKGEDDPECDEDYIESELDRYYEMGVRALFPNHKYSNAFAPTDGDRGIFEIGDFLTTGHYSNFIQECPDVPTVFDKGPVQFAALNQPRDEYLSEPPNPPLEISDEPVNDFLPLAGFFTGGSTEGDMWCQKTGLTDAGEQLVNGMMKRGMILEIDHLSRRAYLDVFGMIEEANYPAAGTHGNTNDGKLYDIGGVSKGGIGRCANSEEPGSLFRGMLNRRADIVEAGGYPAVGFGFDLNGFAGIPGPRFGPFSGCGTQDEETRVDYPFTSYDGAVEFTQPSMGDREVDFNTEGMIHIGLMPELIEDARNTGTTDEELETVFRSAEAYVRMWELAEERSKALFPDSRVGSNSNGDDTAAADLTR